MRAGVPVVYVVTWEEERLEEMLCAASRTLFGDDRPLWLWTAASGFTTGPPDLSKEMYLFELPLPNADELRVVLQSLSEGYEKKQRPTGEWLDRVSLAMQGLSSNESRDLFRRLISESVLEIDAALRGINLAKAQLLMKENCLEVITKTYDIDQIGGLEKLKKWVVSRQSLFSKDAHDANIQAPSGILLMGGQWLRQVTGGQDHVRAT